MANDLPILFERNVLAFSDFCVGFQHTIMQFYLGQRALVVLVSIEWINLDRPTLQM